jgi:hypothetical protein
MFEMRCRGLKIEIDIFEDEKRKFHDAILKMKETKT